MSVFLHLCIMKYRVVVLLVVIIVALSLTDCAKKGSISGGWKDTIPPVPLRYFPENYSTQFQGNEIRINFDEYIRLKDLPKQLVISPPLKYPPQITPMNVSKQLRIIFSDTLKENTTYTLNFGNSIVDNNEDNPLPYFKYAFSTGAYIDSLTVSGTVADARWVEPDENIVVMLYEVNETYTDSLIYLQKPLYLTTTLADPKNFTIENIKPGTYQLVALKSKNDTYLYQPMNDKIGFVKDFIRVPADTTYQVTLFKELPSYQLERAGAPNAQHIQWGYHGKIENLSVEVLDPLPTEFEDTYYFDANKDTVYYWYRPALERDTLQLAITANGITDTARVRLPQDIPLDSLKIQPITGGVMTFEEEFVFTANLPIREIRDENIQIINQDSLPIVFTSQWDKRYNQVALSFEKEEKQSYTIQLLPQAITDFFGQHNDSIKYRISTRSKSDYGYLSVQLIHQKEVPLLVELVTDKGVLVQSLAPGKVKDIYEFKDITPGKYFVRVLVDENQNGEWDSGSFLQKKQPEPVIYFPKLLEIRPNWTIQETFVLEP